MMAHACSSCSKDFKNGAALNFHKRKMHGASKTEENALSKSVPQDESAGQRRSQRQRPVVLKFSGIHGMRDYTKGPFKVSSIPRKLTEERDEGFGKRHNRNSLSSAVPVESREMEKVTTKKGAGKRKSAGDVEVQTSIEADKVHSLQTPSPTTAHTPEGEMPLLSPQCFQSTPVRDFPPSPESGGRAGPKRNKRGKHWKYNQEEKDEPVVRKLLSPSPPRKISKRSDDALSSNSSGSRTGSQNTSERSSDDVSILEMALEEKNAKERRSSIGTSPPRSTASSISGFDDKKKQSTPETNVESEPAFSPPVRQKFIGKSTPCPICGNTGFRNSSHYKNHLEIHEGKRPYLCPVPACGMGYETDIKLLEHVTIRHSHEAKFPCTKCEVEYRTQKGLNNHKCLAK